MSQQCTKLKKKAKKENHSFKNSRDIIFGKNSIILRRNQASRNVYLIKQGQAAIINQEDETLFTYKQGAYLNCIQSSLQLSTFKTIKALKKCHITFQIWTKSQSDKYKNQVLIKKKQQMRFYQIPMFMNVPYELSLELAQFFNIQKHSKHESITLDKDLTYFIVEGTLLIMNSNTNMSILKLQKGEMLIFNKDYLYSINSQCCQLIKISSKLLKTILGQYSQNFQNVRNMQLKELKIRSKSNQNVFRKISTQYQKFINKNQQVPNKFKNQTQLKTDKLQRAKSVNYINNNKDFTSFSDQKRKILQNRDEGYKKISQLNRRKFGRNYILQKRLEISRNIYQNKSHNANIQNNQIGNFFKKGVTLYQSVTLKDDYGIMKQRPFLHLTTKKRRITQKRHTQKRHTQKRHTQKNNSILHDNITLNNAKELRKSFQKKSKSLYNFCAKKHVSQFL